MSILENILIDPNEFAILQVIGEGGFGTLYKVKNLENNKLYAAKIIKSDGLEKGNEQMTFLSESINYKSLNHPNICKFYGISFKSFSDCKKYEPSIIIEYYPNGSLEYLISKEMNHHQWNSTSKYILLLGIATGMMYLHEHNIIHHDLKPSNILLDEDLQPHISDLGCSNCSDFTLKGQYSNIKYVAPEIINGDSYDNSVDVYSFALIMYEILYGRDYSFESSKYKKFNRPKFPNNTTEKARKLIEMCWSQDPRSRPTFDEICEELKSDFSIMNENVDEKEILKYIKYLDSYTEPKDQFKQFKKSNSGNPEKCTKSQIDLPERSNDPFSVSQKNFILGLVSLHGNKKEINNKQAEMYLKRASKEGNGYSSFLLGLLYENSQILTQNPNKAHKFFELSAEQGVSSGLNRIGLSYTQGKYVEKDYKKAIEYFKKGIKIEDPAAMNNLALFYELGKGVDVNYSKAIELYEQSAKKGYPLAYNNLGFCFQHGKGVKQDISKAIDLYQKAAKLGNSEGFKNLGFLYVNGLGVEKSYSKAFAYFKEASELGNCEAMNNLGILYLNGLGVDKDNRKALETFTKSAELGNSEALKILGIIYETGKVVEVDYEKASEYYKKANELGNADAKKRLIKLQNRMK